MPAPIAPDATAGHLGHLTDSQQAAFDAFKRAVAALPRAQQLLADEPTLTSVPCPAIEPAFCSPTPHYLAVFCARADSIPRKPSSSSQTLRHGAQSTTSTTSLPPSRPTSSRHLENTIPVGRDDVTR